MSQITRTACLVALSASLAPDFALAQEGAWAVALDVELDEVLRAEGTAREVVRIVNDLRKAEGLALTDRIVVTVDGSAEVLAALTTHQAHLAAEVLATEVGLGVAGGAHVVELDGAPLHVGLRVAGS